MHHGSVERLAQPIADDDGRPVTPYRSVTLLLTLERAGTIDSDQLDAGEKFRERFFAADLAPLHAAALVRSPSATAGSAPSARIEAARLAVALRRRRRTLGLTQDDAASLLGMSRVTYHRIESGNRRIRLDELAQFCTVLSCSVSDLVGDLRLVLLYERAAKALLGHP
jgi:DNA-binding Xre family transcriptional regulator